MAIAPGAALAKAAAIESSSSFSSFVPPGSEGSDPLLPLPPICRLGKSSGVRPSLRTNPRFLESD